MSAFVPRDELKKRLQEKGNECYGVLLDETTVINLPMAMAMLGLSEESAKKWYVKYGVPRMPGGAWLTTGRRFYQAIERYFDEQEGRDEGGEGLR